MIICYAGVDEELFLQAAQIYKNKEYQKAYELYDSLSRKTPSVWYNMGNCLYYQGNYGQALLCWKKARHHAPYYQQAAIEHNLHHGYVAFGSTYESSLGASLIHALRIRITHMPLWILQLLFLILIYLWWLMSWLAHSSLGRIFRIGMIIALCCIGILIVLHSWFHNRTCALVKKERITVYAGPNERYHALTEIEFLKELMVHEQQDDWCKIQWRDGSGWVVRDELEII